MKIAFTTSVNGKEENWEMTAQQLFDGYYNEEYELPDKNAYLDDCYIFTDDDSITLYVRQFKDLINLILDECLG